MIYQALFVLKMKKNGKDLSVCLIQGLVKMAELMIQAGRLPITLIEV